MTNHSIDLKKSTLEPGDRNILIFAGLALVALAAAALLLGPPSRDVSLPFPSSYSTSSRGAKAAYLLLKQMGYKVERWPNPPDELPVPSAGREVVLILADPFVPASAEERWQLRSFIARGGRILTTGAAGARLIAEAHFKTKTIPWGGWQKFAAEAPSALTRNVPEIAMKAAIRWPSALQSGMECYGDRPGATVITYAIGKGRVIWWADSSPLTNFGLTQAANLMLFLNSASEPNRTDVGGTDANHPRRALILWDEYFHGQRASLWTYLGHTPLPWALLQLSLFAAAAIVTFGRRSEPLRPLRVSGGRLSPLEFVETMGGLYQRKGSAAGALEIVYHRFRSSLLRRLELPGATASEALHGAVSGRFAEEAPALRKMLQQCERRIHDRNLPETEALQLMQEFHENARRLGLGKEKMT
ncbi:MAG: DUF4350 domain-containing protein [Terriglobia bacterium]